MINSIILKVRIVLQKLFNMSVVHIGKCGEIKINGFSKGLHNVIFEGKI